MYEVVIVLIILLLHYVRYDAGLAAAGWSEAALDGLRLMSAWGSPQLLTARYVVWINTKICSRCVIYADGSTLLRMPLDPFYGTNYDAVRITRRAEAERYVAIRAEFAGLNLIVGDDMQFTAANWSAAVQSAAEIIGYCADTPALASGGTKTLVEYMSAVV